MGLIKASRSLFEARGAKEGAAKIILSHTQLSPLETKLGSPTGWSPVKMNARNE